MASSGKRKTTMAKLQREANLRERRSEKAARKLTRKRAQLESPETAGPEAEALDSTEAVPASEPERDPSR